MALLAGAQCLKVPSYVLNKAIAVSAFIGTQALIDSISEGIVPSFILGLKYASVGNMHHLPCIVLMY